MEKIDMFFASLVMLGCALIISGAIILSTAAEFPPSSLPFFLIGGVFGLAGLLGFLLGAKKKD